MTDKNKTALATRQGGALETPASASPVTAMFEQLLAAVKDPNVDAEKAGALLAINERLIDRQAAMDFNAAKMRAVAEMPSITKDGAIKNKAGQVQSRYAHFEAIDKIIRPIALRNGLVYTFDVMQLPSNALGVSCVVSHVGGHTEKVGPMPLAIDSSGSKNATQGAGSTTAYGKRYTLCAAFNIITEDEDKDGGSGVSDAPALTGGLGIDGEDLVFQARKAATEGPAGYEAWFKAQTNTARGFLMDNGEHANCKAAAAEHG